MWGCPVPGTPGKLWLPGTCHLLGQVWVPLGPRKPARAMGQVGVLVAAVAFIFSLKHMNEGVTRSVCVFDCFFFLIYYLIS